MVKRESIKEVRAKLKDALERADYFESCVETFFTGDIPSNASFKHLILATWGRKRLESLKKTPALLQTSEIN